MPSNSLLRMAAPVRLTTLVLLSVIAAVSLPPVQQALADPLTDLREAVLASDAEGVRKALSEGADVNARIENKRGRSALIAAAEKGDAELVKLLLEAGADVNVRNERDNTPLHHAAEKGSIDAIRLLIAAGADVNAKNKRGNTPLKLAQYKGQKEAAKVLKQAGGK